MSAKPPVLPNGSSAVALQPVILCISADDCGDQRSLEKDILDADSLYTNTNEL